jgi:hypothetical protein
MKLFPNPAMTPKNRIFTDPCNDPQQFLLLNIGENGQESQSRKVNFNGKIVERVVFLQGYKRKSRAAGQK